MPLWHLQKLYSQWCWVVRLLFRSLLVVPRFFASGCEWPTEPWVGSFVSPEAFRPWRCSRVDRQHWSSSKRYAAAGAESESLSGAAVWCGSVESFFSLKQREHATTTSMLYHVLWFLNCHRFPYFYIVIELWHQIFFARIYDKCYCIQCYFIQPRPWKVQWLLHFCFFVRKSRQVVSHAL